MGIDAIRAFFSPKAAKPDEPPRPDPVTVAACALLLEIAHADDVFRPEEKARIARERCYSRRDLAEGLAAFTAARNRNIEKLRSVGNADWKRRGVQYGIGSVALEDIPRMMAEHDRGHTTEIAALLAHIREGKPYEATRASAVA